MCKTALPEWMCEAELWSVDFGGEGEDSKVGTGAGDRIISDAGLANCIASVVRTESSGELVHKPAIDIDIPCWLVPSSTPGHYHLYIDIELTTPEYRRLINTLNEVGIVQQGIVNQITRWDRTFLRLPGVKKIEEDLLGKITHEEEEITFS